MSCYWIHANVTNPCDWSWYCRLCHFSICARYTFHDVYWLPIGTPIRGKSQLLYLIWPWLKGQGQINHCQSYMRCSSLSLGFQLYCSPFGSPMWGMQLFVSDLTSPKMLFQLSFKVRWHLVYIPLSVDPWLMSCKLQGVTLVSGRLVVADRLDLWMIGV